MSLVSTLEELALAPSETGTERNAQTLFALWETTQEAVERLLPPPLRPAQRPLALALLSAQPRASIGPVFREASLGLRAEAYGQEGFYFLSMPVTDTAALAFGNESLGYPRKVANIYFYRDGASVGGWVQRHDVRYFAVRADLTGIIGSPDAVRALDKMFEPVPDVMLMYAYSFKYFRSPSLDGFDYPPRLVREVVEFQPTVIARGPASISLCPSQYDPWSEVEVIRALGAVYIEGVTSACTSQVVSEVGPPTWETPCELQAGLR